MRSLADAIARLRECDEVARDENVVLRTNPIRLPDGRASGFVVVIGPPRPLGSISVVRMPSAASFIAKTTLGERRTYPIGKLDDAVSDCDGNVRLATGEYLHAIELIPAPCHYELTVLEEMIVRLTLKCLQEEDRCCPAMHPLLPEVRPPRYDAIRGVRIARLKPVQNYVTERLPFASPSIVAKALARAGMKLPRTRC
jgi:hypothetical protein